MVVIMKNMILKSLILVFLFAGISYGQGYFEQAQKAQKKKDIKTAFALAQEAYSKDSISAALRICLLIKEDKKDVELLDLLAQVWQKNGVLDNTRANYEDAEVLDPKNVKRKYILAELYFKNNQIKESVNKYLEVIKIDSTSKDAYKRIGNIFYMAKKGYYADAAFYLEKALKYFNELDLYHKCVETYEKSNNFEKAYEVAAKGLELYPKDLKLRKSAWENAASLKKYEDALKHVVLIPDSVLTSNEAKVAGYFASLVKNTELNAKYYKLAGEKDPTNKDLFVVLADRAYNENDYDKAIELYDKQLAQEPKHEHSLQYRAYAYLQKKEYNNARGAFLDWIHVSDTSFAAYQSLADCYDKVDSTAKKNETYLKMLKMADGKEKQYKEQVTYICYYFIERCHKQKDWNGAINYAKKILSLKEDFNALIYIGGDYYNMKDYDNALIYYKRAQKINPNNELVKKGLRMLSAD
jgi:tetratricopeptide (TPR) repeat protein